MMGGVLVGNTPTVTIAYYRYDVSIGDTTNFNHTANAERCREQRGRIIRFAAYELSKALGDKVKSPSFPGLALVQVPKIFVIVNMFHKSELINHPKMVAVVGVKVWGGRPNLGNRWIYGKMKRDGQKWYNLQTGLRLVQSYGRSIRSRDDWAHTYVLDGLFWNFIDKNRSIIPSWFLESIVSKLGDNNDR